MKLLYITNGINGSGGLERVLSIKATYLADRLGYDIHVLTLNGGHKDRFYDFSKRIAFHDIEVAANPIWNLFSYWRGIKQVIRDVEPDVVLVCDDGFKGLMFPLVFGRRVPLVYERHAAKELNISSRFNSVGDKIISSMINHSSRKFSSFVVLTNGNKKDWPRVSCEVIPNPLPFEPVEEISEKEKIVLAVGSNNFNKGYDLLIAAWEKVIEKHPGWKLRIIGRNVPSAKLVQQVEHLGIRETVELLEPTKHIDREYRKASVLALPSRSEGFGMVLIEAMSFGVPCVAFNCPHGPADVISNGCDGLLVNAGDVVGFAKALNWLLGDEELRSRMGHSARDNVKKYSIERIADAWDTLFKSLVT